ncbi:probable E3 ubiquitin-protein ligase HERC4 isoform X1 [Aplysia californica]|uniref:Probable E3 ubiquitin-protein ligase HERC4 isoform X1 n=1 Tax=Aplysia californica TaxID=6500 RepID=A0ABM1VYB2_APLCA|nr:probable E3 ubiquitin-protein ligase HERC4 isoform X1 [Aplysia californica]XP_035827405.1 probable E3 ubiquitin-protein ligase HERC4 isoform X1 [Aplysia californica]XP_035827406.1 probable E3 ubiquitin-protein ligase HERC4 isoform X1 [Aplysia californica]XP_035827407.1 probable E3 ubiquitin-protein ligase HERC4 isoform X1 [Aplysia californica]XP_035827408.1 probable E3 ubiquitin-protein ligase HERC4 isoform X1 [Aplysia californica]XP_035827409.1 probable E3 ubiquitin-protein ligase HERC4 is
MSAVLAWGKATFGVLGIGSSEENAVRSPKQVETLDNVDLRQISIGENHSLICGKDGAIFSCGANDFSQCGRDRNLNKFGRIEAGLLSQQVIQVAAGANHSVALTQAWEVFTWGKNDSGQLGRGDIPEEARGIPKLVKSLAVHCVLQVACGNDHCIVLTNDSLVRVWGSNSYGQLGLGKNAAGKYQNIPEVVTSVKGIPVEQIAAGGNHSFLLSKSGAVYGWGRNSFGQLGVNDTKDYDMPRQCRSLRTQKIKYICAGENHSAALTADGRVFTFGAGSYGQLGHNSNSNEILPRQVIELSGVEVSQIACGRGHTLAFVPSTGRLYAFGLGGSGQLGTSSLENKNSPFLVQGPFVSQSGAGTSNMQVDNQGPELCVKSIYTGGDHSFVLAQDCSACHSDDFRERDHVRQILTLSQKRIEMFHDLKSNDTPPHELSDEMTKIFSHASCLNGSFLMPRDEHYGSSSKKHGVDMNAVREFFQGLSKLPNIVIKQYICTSIEQDLIPMLPKSPPDVEALRLYIMLPECHLFDQPKLYSSIICPFANAFLSMDPVAQKVLYSWWPSNQPSFFNRLVVIYKGCIEYLLQLPDTTNPLEVSRRQSGLFSCMEMLQKLYAVNEENHQIIPYHKFYVPELKERVNIREDYISWVQHTHRRTQVGGFAVQGLYFCNYPFLFDGAAKSVLLQTDAALQMRNAIESVQRQNFRGAQHLLQMFTGMSMPPPQFDPVNPCLVLFVDRNNLVQDTLLQLQSKLSADLKKPLKVVFKGEEAVDEGGVRKEFFMLLLREVMDPKYGMFNVDEDSYLQWFNPSTFEEANMFRMIGILCGLAIYNFTIIDLHFPLALYKKLLKKPITADDLKELSPDVGKGLQDLLDFDGDEFEDVFSLYFEVMTEQFGEQKSVELCEDGKNVSVNQNNKQKYVDLYVDYILNKSVETQFSAFSEGFLSVCGGEVLELFHPQELQAMVVGNEDYDFLELEKNTDYKGEYHRYHPTIKFFWEVFHEMSLEDKKKFLMFLTGSDRIPVFGMKYVKIIIQPTCGGEKFLPVAHTCFNVLDLPKYSTKETLQDKLLLAIQQTEGFGLV